MRYILDMWDVTRIMHAQGVQVIVGCKYGSSGPSAGFSSFLCALLDKRVDRPASADPLFLTFVRVKNGLSVCCCPPLPDLVSLHPNRK